jgi:hypothetical protein
VSDGGSVTAERVLTALFAATLFAGSFLMFLLEPMVAKIVLPMLGGAPMVWNTCVVFFQITLLAGYAYAHGPGLWDDPRRKALAYAALVVIPLATLPITIRVAASPMLTGHPIAWLFLVLASSIGLPFLALSASSSMLQKLFAETRHRAAHDPYFLYTASNLGSLLALAAYPTLVEPFLRIPDQRRLWTIGYVVFAIFALICAVLGWRRSIQGRVDDLRRVTDVDTNRSVSIGWPRRGRWLALAFIPSSLMLGATSYLAAEVAAVPLLWILPLATYLITFVLAFSRWAGRCRAIANRSLPLLVVPLALFIAAQAWATVGFAILFNLMTFAMAALLCHCELARGRPSPSHLTEFYFWIAAGGMLGGLFNTLVAPVLFSSPVEYPLVLVLACLVRSEGRSEIGGLRDGLRALIVPAGIAVLTAGLMIATRQFRTQANVQVAVLALPAVAAFSRSRRPVEFALCVGAMVSAAAWTGNAEGVLHAERTFFGVYRVAVDPSGRYHSLMHGTTLHGMQAVSEARRNEPLMYYHRTGPFGQAFEQLPHTRAMPDVAVVGLGVGAMAAYALSNQQWTFYEIDPAIERIAREPGYFSFLQQCAGRCRVVIGDARLSLAGATQGQYGLIVLDAFSSDAIPVHLMTSEAVSLYLTRLAPGGVLAFHLSNRHLSLGPVLARLALAYELTALEQYQNVSNAEAAEGKSESRWMIMGRNVSDLGTLIADRRWTTPRVEPSAPLWTDDFSNILGVFRAF